MHQELGGQILAVLGEAAVFAGHPKSAILQSIHLVILFGFDTIKSHL